MFWRNRARCVSGFFLATGVVLLLRSPVGAINIIPVFNAGASDVVGFDPGAAGLIQLFDHAESYYQDVFEDSHTITINFWYDNLDPGILGSHSLVSQSGGRETEANIRIDTSANWFIDPTPANDSEFNMQQTLWRDLNGTQQADWYNFGAAAVPATFEVGYTGAAVSGGAVGATDMLSVIMHEVGHALGMSAANTSTQTETVDGDYDFDPDFVFGENFGVETANTSGDDNLNIAHVENTNALMTPSIPSSTRRLPSHTDLFAMASGHSYVSLDVPRREFYGGSNWNNDANWSGNTDPGIFDDVYVRDAQGSPTPNLTAGLTANGFAANVFISEGGNVDTNGFLLNVDGDVIVSDLDSDVFVNPGGELQADRVFIENQSEIEMSGGTLDANRLEIDAGTQLEGTSAGAISVDVSSVLVNNGEIDANGDSVMTFTSVDANPWDLDGTSGDGIVDAFSGDLIFDTGGLLDEFDGQINVGAGHQLRIDAAWTQRGDVDMNGGATAAELATITGGAIDIAGGTISADGFSVIDAVAEYSSGVAVSLVDSDTELRLGNSTADTVTFSGTSTFSGPGRLVLNGDATVTGTVNISVDTFDFDGGTISDTTIASTGVMNITGTSIADPYDGIVTINGGVLNVATTNAWTMSGTLDFSSSGELNGSLVNITDTVTTTGRGIINAEVDFEAAANVTLTNAADVLELNGVTNYRGGTYAGSGRIQQDGEANVLSNTTIGIAVFDWDGSVGSPAVTNVSPGVTLTLNVNTIDVGVGAFDGTVNVNSGVVAVNTAAPWTVGSTGQINMDNVGGGTPTLNGMPVTVSGAVNSTGGLVTINSAVTISTIGDYNAGSSAIVNQNGNLTQNGNMMIGGTAQVNANGFTDFAASSNNTINGVLRLNATGRYLGGAHTGSGQIELNGLAIIEQTTEFNVDFQFRNGSATEIFPNQEMRLATSGTVEAGALVAGPGRLRNLAGSVLTLEDASTVSTTLINEGVVSVGDSPGISTVVDDYVQTATGLLSIELGGLVQGLDYDLLRAGGTASLEGELDVSLLGLFMPSLGDAFEVVRASSVVGTFDTLTLPGLGAGLEWDIAYGPGNVVLEIIQSVLLDCDFDLSSTCDIADLDLLYGGIDVNDLAFDINNDGMTDNADITEWLLQAGAENGVTYLPGDTDLDGSVLGNDFSTLAFNFGNSPATWGEGNFDGNAGGSFLVGGSDFSQLAFNFGFVSISESGGGTFAPVPEPDMSPILSFAALVGLLWRRR